MTGESSLLCLHNHVLSPVGIPASDNDGGQAPWARVLGSSLGLEDVTGCCPRGCHVGRGAHLARVTAAILAGLSASLSAARGAPARPARVLEAELVTQARRGTRRVLGPNHQM